jgi:polyhydroxybutyrate depolymerase
MKKWLLRFALIFPGMPVTMLLAAAVAFRLANRTNGALVSSGKQRSYLLYVPKTYNPARPAPLVISLHGYAEWPAHQMQISRWNDLADQYGFLVVYPSGTRFPLRWRTRGEPGSETDPMLDVTFISDLIDHLQSGYNLDPARIYANGLSNGGGMSFVLSCKLSQRIAAIGCVSGAYLLPSSACRPARPVPAIFFHGTQDPIVPYQGGPSRAFNLPFPSIPAWVDALARQYGCSGAPLQLPQHGNVHGLQYTHCSAQAEVVFYTITGGGHSWPGGKPLPKSIVGNTTRAIDATKIMWEFFQKHPLPPDQPFSP